MAMAAPVPSGCGAVMWWASAVLPTAEQLGVDRWRRGLRACSSSSSTTMPAPFAEHEAVAILVERPAGGRRVVVAHATGPGGDEAAQAHGRDAPPRRRRPTMTSAWSYWMVRRASPMAWPAEAQAVETAVFGPRRPNSIEMLPGRGVGDHLGDDERADRAGPSLSDGECCSSNSFRPPMPLPRMTPQRKRIFAGEIEPAVLHGLHGGHQGELGEAIQAPGRLRRSSHGFRLEPSLDLAAELDLEGGGVELLDRADAALARAQRGPEGWAGPKRVG